MKNPIIIMSLCIVSLCSCTKTLYTHQDYMSRFKTRTDVAAKFGTPAEKIVSDSTEEWLYRFEKTGVKPEQILYTQVSNTVAKTVDVFTMYRHIIIFSFDKQGNVIQWYGQGVDLGAKKFSAGKTIGLVAGIAGGLVLLGVIITASFHPDISWSGTGYW